MLISAQFNGLINSEGSRMVREMEKRRGGSRAEEWRERAHLSAIDTGILILCIIAVDEQVDPKQRRNNHVCQGVNHCSTS